MTVTDEMVEAAFDRAKRSPLADLHDMRDVLEAAERVWPKETEELLFRALKQIAEWSDSYPLSVFPEPDEAYYAHAVEVLTANGMTLDRLSAAAIRHALDGIGKIAKDALEAVKPVDKLGDRE